VVIFVANLAVEKGEFRPPGEVGPKKYIERRKKFYRSRIKQQSFDPKKNVFCSTPVLPVRLNYQLVYYNHDKSNSRVIGGIYTNLSFRKKIFLMLDIIGRGYDLVDLIYKNKYRLNFVVKLFFIKLLHNEITEYFKTKIEAYLRIISIEREKLSNSLCKYTRPKWLRRAINSSFFLLKKFVDSPALVSEIWAV